VDYESAALIRGFDVVECKLWSRGCSGRDHSEKLRVEASDSSRLWVMMKSCVLCVDMRKREEKIFLKV
jgi:hypothetical protein